MKKIARTLNSVVLVLAALVLAAAVLVVAGPRLVGWTGLIVMSGSMEPAMPVGGLALVEPASISDLHVGDIGTFRHPQRSDALVSHRVISVEEQGGVLSIKTKGDANEKPDGWIIPGNRVVGKVRLTVPYLGYAADKLRHRENFYLLMGIPAALLIINEVSNIARELRKLRGRKEASP